jgi:hypothetical protein
MNRVTDGDIWIESDLPLANTQLWSIPLRLMRNVVEGGAANLGSIPPRLAGNLETIRDIFANWIHGYKVPLKFEISSDVSAPAKGVSLFFSCGVDSFYSLIQHRDEIENLVLIHGFDVPLSDSKTFELTEARAREAANHFGKRLIVVRTNLHFEQPSVPGGWVMYGGAALVAVALALEPNHGKIYIASSHTYDDLCPWGSHPLLDPLWSTEAVQIVHDGVETRMNKLRVVVQHPEVLSRLRVCWENQGNYNCGRCEKCVRTMLALRALGVDHCAAFPYTLTPELVRRLDLSFSCVPLWREFLDAGLPPALNEAVRSAIHSYEAGLPPRTGHFKRWVKRWLYAARNAGRALISPLDHS